MIDQLIAENTVLKSQVASLDKRLADALDTHENILLSAQKAFDARDYATAAERADRLIGKYPNAASAATARRLATAARRRIAEAEAVARAQAEREQKSARTAEQAATRDRMRTLRRNLHGNLDGKGGGAIRGWEWEGDTFVLIIDPRLAVPNSATYAAMTARAMFESNEVPLPKRLVFRDPAGNEIASGTWVNVPSLVSPEYF